MRNGAKKKFMEIRPDSACIPMTKKNLKERDHTDSEDQGEQEVRFTGKETGFFNDGENEFYDVECSTRKAS